MNKIKDIKPIVDIPDFSFYAYIVSVIIFILIISIFFYKIVRIFSKKKVDKRKEMIEELKNLDFSDSKKAAYLITKYGRELVHDDRSYKIFEELLYKLQKYKYRKNPSKITKDVKDYLKLFIETVNE